MKHVYILQHAYETPAGTENVKLIGVYSSEEHAKAAEARLADKPGFCEHVDGFHISEMSLDEDHWTEGFISWSKALE